jgi:hypothetical protein
MSPLKDALMRNTQEGDVKEITIVCTVANSLSKEYDSIEACSQKANHV